MDQKKLIKGALALLVLAAVVVGILWGTGVIGGKTEQVKAEAAPATLRDWFGGVSGYTYLNQPAGLGCVLDEWLFYGEEDVLSLTEGLAAEDMDLEVREALAKTAEKSAVVMMAMSSDTMKNVTMTIMDTTDYQEELASTGLKGQLEMIRNSTEAYFSTYGAEDVACELMERDIGGETYLGLEFSCTYQGMPIYQKELAVIRGDIMVMVTVTSYKTDETESVLEHFVAVR